MIASLTWSRQRAGEAMSALARSCGLPVARAESPTPPSHDDEDEHAVWMEQVGGWLGLELEQIDPTYEEVGDLISAGGPALLATASGGYLLLLRTRRGRTTLLSPDGAERTLLATEVSAALRAPLEQEVEADVDRIIDRAGLRPRRARRARAALFDQWLAGRSIPGSWLLRLPPEAPLRLHASETNLARRLVLLLVAYTVQHGLWIASWWLVGRGALEGRIDVGWLTAWVMMLATLVLLRVLNLWWAGRLAIDAGALVKRRLLAGALRMDPDVLRTEGVGQSLGRVLESEALESLALSGGFLSLFAVVEVLIAIAVLAAGAAPVLQILLLIAWLAVAIWLTRTYYHQRRGWTERRLTMTHDLVEIMVGHTTRLAQQHPMQMHAGEDDGLDQYLVQSRRMDRSMVALTALVPRGWLLLGIVGLAPAFVTGTAGMAGLAIALGGTLLAYRALQKLVQGLAQLSGAAIAWQQVAPMFQNAEQREPIGDPVMALAEVRSRRSSKTAIVNATGIVYGYKGRPEPILRGCDLEIRTGDKVVLEGDSGCGKSTLGSLLAGVRQPTGGLILLDGLDHHTLGSHGWRRRVVYAPQFHENHIFTGPLLFNLLLGRRWPPTARDVRDARRVCNDLDLGPLIEHMPGGIMQMVGETGWQMSHGERARVCMARALLQNSDVVILDESFGTLDPRTQQRVMKQVMAHDAAIIVIAHP